MITIWNTTYDSYIRTIRNATQSHCVKDRNMATAVTYGWPGAVIKKATHLDRGNCAKVAH